MRSIRKYALGACLGAMAATGLTTAAVADEHGREEHARMERHGGPVFHGEIGRFHEHDWGVWHGGHWEHMSHGGRLGWWWVAGGLWYFYPYPVYPYPDPYLPPTMLQPQPPQAAEPPPPPTPSSWYYCRSGRGYYPYVPSCPEGWQPVAPNGASPAPPPR